MQILLEDFIFIDKELTDCLHSIAKRKEYDAPKYNITKIILEKMGFKEKNSVYTMF